MKTLGLVGTTGALGTIGGIGSIGTVDGSSTTATDSTVTETINDVVAGKSNKDNAEPPLKGKRRIWSAIAFPPGWKPKTPFSHSIVNTPHHSRNNSNSSSQKSRRRFYGGMSEEDTGSNTSSSSTPEASTGSSPDATTISTGSHSDVSVQAAKRFTSSVAAAIATIEFVGDDGHDEFLRLQSDLSKFSNRQGSSKANLLRLTLIPFLRQQLHLVLPSTSALRFRASVLEAWWKQLLEDVHLAAPSDKAVYYEAISSIMDRPEWLVASEPFAKLLASTTSLSLEKCSKLSIAASMQAFVGKTFAYGFFHLSGFGEFLLSRLYCPDTIMERLLKQLDIDIESPISTSYALQALPSPVHSLVGIKAAPAVKRNPILDGIVPKDLSDAWTRLWHADSGVFIAFLKHYFSVLSRLLPPPPPPEKPTPQDEDYLRIALVAPGLSVILGSIAADLDHLVRTNRSGILQQQPDQNEIPVSRSRSSSGPGMNLKLPARMNSDLPSNHGMSHINSTPHSTVKSNSPPHYMQGSNRANQLVSGNWSNHQPRMAARIDKLKLFKCVREILHNDEACIPYYHHFGLQFDRALQAVAIGTSVYHMEACVTMCDLAEEWLSSLTISHHAASAEQVRATMHLAVDWGFWISVAKRMLSSCSCHAEVRSLAFLFNIWIYLPEDYLEEATAWILSTNVWESLFYHWSPLVRSYYHRLLCYRVTEVAMTRRLSGEVITQSHLKAREILGIRLQRTFAAWNNVNVMSSLAPATAPSLPLPKCCIGVAANPAALSSPHDIHRVYPFDIFDNAAYWASPSRSVDSVQAIPNQLRRYSQSSPVRSDSSSRLVPQPPRSPSLPTLTLSLATANAEGSKESDKNNVVSQAESEKPAVSRKWWKSLKSLTTRDPNDNDCATSRDDGSIKSVSTANHSIRSVILGGKEKDDKHHKPGHRSTHSRELSITDVPPPRQLVGSRPEIRRPQHRFVLVPTRFYPRDSAPLTIPRLPHSNPLCHEASNLPERAGPNGASLWNYGARSLAEWNVTVSVYEEFLNTWAPREMPFLVAEIPWRVAVG